MSVSNRLFITPIFEGDEKIVGQEDKDFKPKEGETILTGWSEDEMENTSIYLFTDADGRFVCVHGLYEKEYRTRKCGYLAIAWPYAKSKLTSG
jgi:hypothetical protein